MKRICFIAACFVTGIIYGCGEQTVKTRDWHEVPVALQPPIEVNQNDWTVISEGHFADSNAYGGVRSIFRFKHKGGIEFVGVTGVGISEVGRHQMSKTSIPDER